jgi:hypothetical protein
MKTPSLIAAFKDAYGIKLTPAQVDWLRDRIDVVSEFASAGEEVAPSTLAAGLSTSPSASLRGEPAPDKRNDIELIGKAVVEAINAIRCGHSGRASDILVNAVDEIRSAQPTPEGWQLVPKTITAAIACALEGCGGPEEQTEPAIEALVEAYADTWQNVLAAAPQAPTAPEGWQPIETAPKEPNEPVLGYGYFGGDRRHLYRRIVTYSAIADAWYTYDGSRLKLICWCPLLAAPQSGKEAV